MKKALLTFWWNPETKEEGYVWETTKEQTISTHSTKLEALNNRPEDYKYLDSEWR